MYQVETRPTRKTIQEPFVARHTQHASLESLSPRHVVLEP